MLDDLAVMPGRPSIPSRLLDLNKKRSVSNLRFVEQPRTEINSTHQVQKKSLSDDIESLQKKAKYLERQLDEANGQLRDIVSARWVVMLTVVPQPTARGCSPSGLMHASVAHHHIMSVSYFLYLSLRMLLFYCNVTPPSRKPRTHRPPYRTPSHADAWDQCNYSTLSCLPTCPTFKRRCA